MSNILEPVKTFLLVVTLPGHVGPNAQELLPYDTKELAEEAARQAISTGCLEHEVKGQKLFLQTGPGTKYFVMAKSDVDSQFARAQLAAPARGLPTR